jgi:hypothetical protein
MRFFSTSKDTFKQFNKGRKKGGEGIVLMICFCRFVFGVLFETYESLSGRAECICIYVVAILVVQTLTWIIMYINNRISLL